MFRKIFPALLQVIVCTADPIVRSRNPKELIEANKRHEIEIKQ